MKRVLFVIVFGLMFLVAVILIRTLRFTTKQFQVDAPAPIALNRDQIARHLSEAIQFKTISFQDSKQFDTEEFLGLHQYLEQTFPMVHATLAKEVVGDLGLLYTWEGSESKEKPILLCAHMDVVPVESEKKGDWTYPPFEGRIAEGYIWGRGTMDVKVGVLGILEAVETLLGKGFQPQRTIYLAFGHDEETGGQRGAARIAALLHSRGIELEYMLDEGLVITDGILPGVSRSVALVGIAEKGKVSIKFTVEGRGGHASMPPPHTTISILSTAIHNLERHQPSPRIEGPVRQMFEYVGPEMPFWGRMAFANIWCFGRLIERKLSTSRATNALIRTTMAPTIFKSGVEEDVLPKSAEAVVNFRILPSDSIAGVVERASRAIDDTLVKIRLLKHSAFQPSVVSDIASPSFKMLQRTIHQVFPGVIVAPSLFIAASDSRHFAALTRNIYRFVPMRLKGEDLKRLHGRDERISVDNYEEIVRFYIQLIHNSSSDVRPTTPSDP